MLVTLLGMVNEVKPVQLLKELAPKLSRLLGRLIEVRPEQPENA